MKKMKKMMALVIAMVMILAMAMPAMAATGELTPDTSVTIDGLEGGDVVSFYKLIEWQPSIGWAYTTDVQTAATTAKVTLPTLTTITGSGSTPGAISAADGGILAQAAQKMTAINTITVAAEASSVTYGLGSTATDAEKVAFLGLYVALVKPATADYLYNPIFVAADYYQGTQNSNSITVQEGQLSYSPAALAKKEEITLKKESGNSQDLKFDVNVGDTIPFTITSVVPEFSTSYMDPQYSIHDTMSSGLVLLNDSENHVTVKVRDVGASSETPWTNLTENTNYTLTANTDGSGFTVTLASAYLTGNTAAKDIVVTYSAKVTSIDDYNVNQKENEATVKFSNNPGDSNSYSLLEDRTNHYSFSLDAKLLGNNEWENSELVKVGLNPDGTEITQQTLSNGISAGVLEGAEFGLYTDEALTKVYTNDLNSTGKYTSDANGKLNISGLDAGTYYLKELSAPAGYIKSTDVYKIVIAATYTTEPGGTYKNTNGILVKYAPYDYLTSYSVTVTNTITNNVVTSNFTITNEGTEKKTAISSSESDNTTKLNNTKGTELPSTGGIGTTIFYVVGAILVLGAGILLVTRRRMKAE